MEDSSNLCLVCKNLFREMRSIIEERPGPPGFIMVPDLTQEDSYVHHQRLSSLKNSAEEKCYICIRLWEFISDEAGNHDAIDTFGVQMRYQPEISTDDGSDGLFAGTSLDEYLVSRPPVPTRRPLELLFEALLTTESGARNLPLISIRGNPFEQARHWLSTCRTQHRHCSEGKSHELPTRLIKVGKEGSAMTAFLCESATLPAHIEYLTLSHCWGRVPFLTLTEENIGQLKVSIPVDDLPKVFQDAMLTTLELGFKYLWIDSLYIIQDSSGSSDWLSESSKMDTVYRIAPARRILHFAHRQMYWECYEKTCCEAFTNGMGDSTKAVYISNTKVAVRLMSVFSHHPQTDDVYEGWLYLIGFYGRASLTYPTDKLPALSGLAKVFMSYLKDDYLAGIWKRDLLHGLLWLALGEVEVPPNYRAPSWSWASVDCSLSHLAWYGGETKPHRLVRVLETLIVPAAQDITGQVIGGHIRVSGSLQKIIHQHQFPADANAKNVVTARLTPENSTEKVYSMQILTSTNSEGKGPRELIFNFSIPWSWIRQELFLLPILYSSGEEEDKCDTLGLVLHHEESANGTYKRIGTFHIFEASAYRKLFLSESRLEGKYYESKDRFGQYTIRII